MSALWTARDLAEATGGRRTVDFDITGLSIDSRSVKSGDLFIALTDQRDGHDFVVDALAKGAAGALVSRMPEGIAPEAPLVCVDDVAKALTSLARASRARTQAKVIAVTGSAGKTSTKDMLSVVLSRQGRTHASEASYNNHWGVPLTLARMPADAEFAVVEIGMNHPGEIAPLAQLTAPDVAIVTTVAPAHLEAFDGIEAIAREKAALFGGLRPGGTAILNADLPVASILRAAALSSAEKVVGFGEGAQAEMRATDIRIMDAATVVQARCAAGPILFKVMAPGRHFAINALAVLAAVESVGADPVLAAADLARWSPPAGRGARELVMLDPVEDAYILELIDDAYNANPASMAAGLEVLAAAHPRDGLGRVANGRRIAILGDMLELGPDEARLHADIADLPQVAALNLIHCVGPRMRHLYDALPAHKRGKWVSTADELAARAVSLIDAGDVILVKGSKSSHVSRVVDAIRKLGHPRPEQDSMIEAR